MEDKLKEKRADNTDEKENFKLGSTETPGFDLAKLRLSQNFHEHVGVKKAILTVPVRKPNRQDFIRVHPGEDMFLETAVLELREDRETYLVEPDLWADLSVEIVPKVLYTTVNRQGVLTLWPIRLPGEDGRLDTWNSSALEAADMAKFRWIRLVSNISLGAYEVFQANSNIPEPEWPEISFSELVKIAFKERFIHSLEHPAVRRLRGEA